MVKFSALFAAMFSALFFFIPRGGFAHIPHVDFLHYVDVLAKTGKENARPTYLNAVPYLAADGKEYVQLASGKAQPIEKGSLIFAPLFGSGFFAYEKLGKELFFYSKSGELYWRKPYHSYPVTADAGGLIALLTGDGNEIDIADKNGNLIGVKKIGGNFLSDFKFASRTGQLFALFSGGEVYGVNAQGEVQVFFQVAHEKADFFAKSIAVSSDARLLLIHALEAEKDILHVLRVPERPGEVGKEINRIELSDTFAYTIPMEIAKAGFLVAAGGQTCFYRLDDASAAYCRPNDGSIYQPLLADEHMLARMEGRDLVMTDSLGNEIMRTSLPERSAANLSAISSKRQSGNAAMSNKIRIVAAPESALAVEYDGQILILRVEAGM